MASIPNDSIVYYESGQLKRLAAGDDVAITGDFQADNLTANATVSGVTGSFSGNVSVGGNLVVTGDIISRGAYNVAVGDAFIDLLASNTTTGSAQSAGWTANIEAQTSAITATAFTAGSGGTNPVITVSSDPTINLANDDIIQVSGSANGKNDGLYVILSLTSTTITVKGVGLTAVSAQTPFARNQLVASSGETASVVKAKVAAFAVSNGALFAPGPVAVAAGVWCYHTGETETSFVNSWTALTTVTQTLQGAYDGGNTIALAGSRNLTVTAPLSGNAAISLGANAASDFTVTGNTLTLSASRIDLNTGDVKFAKAGVIAADTSAVSAGAVVYFDSSFNAQNADANSATLAVREAAGVAVDSSATGYVATVAGTRVFVEFGGATPTTGAIAYLSTTAGQATTTAPTSGARVMRLGYVTAAAASGSLYEIVWNPQYIIDLP